MIEGSLYKYISQQYCDAYLSGHILFRPLSYFIQLDGDNRGDVFEGSHVDWPHNDITLDSYEPDGITHRGKVTGDFAFRRSVKYPHKIFIHCTSKKLDESLFKKFGADRCVEITEPQAFASKLRAALKKQVMNLEPKSITFENVEYYDIKKAHVMRDIEVASHIPFFKPREYEEEQEFRFLYGRLKSLETIMQITNAAYNRLADDNLKHTFREAVIKIGDISNICKIHAAGTASKRRAG